jgi:hypothetical protein
MGRLYIQPACYRNQKGCQIWRPFLLAVSSCPYHAGHIMLAGFLENPGKPARFLDLLLEPFLPMPI